MVIGISDPNPQVAGRGIQMLKDGGVDVVVGCLRDECYEVNREFMQRMEDESDLQ